MSRQDQFIPHLVVSDGMAALKFYEEVFGAKAGDVTTRTPRTLGGTTARITLQTDDPDAVVERAVARGASVLMAVQTMFWGARYGKIVDPFGHEWGINQQLEEQTEDQTNAAAKEF